ncbi:efflux RND transporter periplasmic adaptor subunit [Dyella sp.]|uniref:efflux RND transporter periplasmic adaptor subunit n=1 Tax=Dyella sp. TaxID=1869338 RepID=UPI002ED30280
MTSRLIYPSVLIALACLAGCSNNNDTHAKDKPGTSATSAYQAMARGRIDIEGGLLRLAMPRDGVVAEVKAHEGDQVHKGQLLARLDTQPAQLALDTALAEQKQLQVQATLLESRIKAAQQRAQRLANAAAAGASDGQTADDAKQAAMQLQGELESTRATTAMAAQKVASARYELAQRSLIAPIDGVVVNRNIQPGASASVNTPVFTLLPDVPRIVRAELNESFVGVVHEGMEAEVLDDSGSAAHPLHARVLRIGAVFGPSTLEEDPMVRSTTRSVECVLVFDQPPPLSMRIGQRVLVRFPGANGTPATVRSS